MDWKVLSLLETRLFLLRKHKDIINHKTVLEQSLDGINETMKALWKPEFYKCAKCWKINKKWWTEEEQEAEYKDIFDWYSWPTEVVCDPCYQLMMKIMPPKLVKKQIMSE